MIQFDLHHEPVDVQFGEYTFQAKGKKGFYTCIFYVDGNKYSLTQPSSSYEEQSIDKIVANRTRYDSIESNLFNWLYYCLSVSFKLNSLTQEHPITKEIKMYGTRYKVEYFEGLKRIKITIPAFSIITARLNTLQYFYQITSLENGRVHDLLMELLSEFDVESNTTNQNIDKYGALKFHDIRSQLINGRKYTVGYDPISDSVMINCPEHIISKSLREINHPDITMIHNSLLKIAIVEFIEENSIEAFAD